MQWTSLILASQSEHLELQQNSLSLKWIVLGHKRLGCILNISSGWATLNGPKGESITVVASAPDATIIGAEEPKFYYCCCYSNCYSILQLLSKPQTILGCQTRYQRYLRSSRNIVSTAIYQTYQNI